MTEYGHLLQRRMGPLIFQNPSPRNLQSFLNLHLAPKIYGSQIVLVLIISVQDHRWLLDISIQKKKKKKSPQ